jgi:membrane-associated phospholipid phosphatase
MFVILRLFKDVWSLPRPLAVLPSDSVNVIGPGHRRSAFPSGHTSTFALYAGIWAFSAKRQVTSWALLGLAVLVGISRMAVGVHWPSDVLGGLALGWASAWLGLRWAPRAPWGLRPAGRKSLAILLLICGLALLLVYDSGYDDTLLFQRGLALACLVWGGVETHRVWKSP